MQWYEILIIVAAAAFVVGICVWRVVRRKKGKAGCEGCSACSGQCPCCLQKADGQTPSEVKKSQSSR